MYNKDKIKKGIKKCQGLKTNIQQIDSNEM